MRNQTRKLTFLLSNFFLFLLVELARADQPFSAIFVFGDSLADVGNNDDYPTVAKCNYPPYGVDYINREATGRWTNGKNVIDIFAGYVNMSSPPPFYSIKSLLAYENCSGVSFASGSCGILPITGFQYLCLNFDMQLVDFKLALAGIESVNFPNNKTSFNLYMSRSICVIIIGNNDYLNCYFSTSPLYFEYENYTCSQFAEILASNMSQKIQELYNLGCMKFIIANIAALGCIPYERLTSGGLPNTCNETQNDCVNLYNVKLRDKVLPNLTAKSAILPEFKYVYIDIWNKSRDCTINPSSCGLINSSNPCCTTYLNGTCLPIPDALPNVPIISSLLCPNRSTHLFFDAYHPTYVVDQMIIDGCTNPTNPYYPSPCDKPLSYLF